MKTEFYAMEYEAWDQGTNLLTAEEEGCYLRLCHQMYRVRGPVENWSFMTLGGMWRCHPNKARAILGQLEVKGKVTRTPDGHLANTRVTAELHHMHTLRTRKVDAGRVGGIASGDVRSKSLKSLDASEAHASIEVKQKNTVLPQNEPPDLTGQDNTGHNNSVEAAQQEAAPPANKRGRRLKGDWAPSEAETAFAKAQGLSDEDVNRETLKFRNHWVSKPGKDACKLDWPKTWQNWVLGAHRARPVPGAVVAFKPKPPPVVRFDVSVRSDAEWTKHLRDFNFSAKWDRSVLGPTPDERGCVAPKRLWPAAGLKVPPPMVNFGGGVTKAWTDDTAPRAPAIPPDLLEDAQ